MNESSFLARKILLNLEKTKLTLNRGHRFAGFAVLKSYDIPSILVEIGFLSNKKEERKLLKQNYLDELTDGLSNAIEDYFKSVK
jgi:N-acetylmuramoyl-L-alanine amidase